MRGGEGKGREVRGGEGKGREGKGGEVKGREGEGKGRGVTCLFPLSSCHTS